MNNGNPSHVGGRRRRTGTQDGPSGGHRSGARGGAYSGKRRAGAALPFDLPLPEKLQHLGFGRRHLAVAGAAGLVIAVGLSIVLANLPGDAPAGPEPADAAFLYADGQALPDEFAADYPGLMNRVHTELETRYGLTPDELYDPSRPDGPRVVLTLDKALQDAAESLTGEAGVVAVEPGTGAVLCYYGAESETGVDLIGPTAPHPPSSVFNLLTAAAALEAGASVDSWWADADADVTLTEAVREARDGAMDAVAVEYGVEAVLDTANGMGLAAIADADGTRRDLAAGQYDGLKAADLGTYPVSVVDMATVYATIAAGGVRADTHLVAEVLDSADDPIEPDQGVRTEQAVAATTAQDLQYIGLGQSEAIADRDFFGFGADYYGETTQTWFVGAIPQLSVAAWANGTAAVDGGIPLWRSVIDTAIEARGYEAQSLPGASGAGDDLTDGIADDEGRIDPSSEYCLAHPDEPACAASQSPSESPSSQSPTPDETTSAEPDPEPTTTREPDPEPTTSEPPEETTTDCGWVWC
ncbi:penicillin-binding transpeptidase domain-containing protein [Glycomyces sp. NPDC046736]|uniref:penicillin-binding transpeptidase domain-containing protein n=1 Tax=Glycomyces sp. NPDC046736 TaxID=3155615 RepID=UPI0033EA1B2A